MMNEADQRQVLERGLEALVEARDLLWWIAEEDGDAERNRERWNAGGEGFLLLEQISAVLPQVEALRDDMSR